MMAICHLKSIRFSRNKQHKKTGTRHFSVLMRFYKLYHNWASSYRGYLLFRSQVLNCPNWLVGWIGGGEVEVGNQHSRQNISKIPSALMFVVNPRHFCQGDGGSGWGGSDQRPWQPFTSMHGRFLPAGSKQSDQVGLSAILSFIVASSQIGISSSYIILLSPFTNMKGLILSLSILIRISRSTHSPGKDWSTTGKIRNGQ